jgi:hypothetical protein
VRRLAHFSSRDFRFWISVTCLPRIKVQLRFCPLPLHSAFEPLWLTTIGL